MTFDTPEITRSIVRHRDAAFSAHHQLAATQRTARRRIDDAPHVEPRSRQERDARQDRNARQPRSDRAVALQAPHIVADDKVLRARFERVVIPYLDEAHVLARALIGNSTDAQDIVQDASLSAYRAILSYADGDARGWVLTIVRHAAYQWLRKNRRGALVHLDDLELIEETMTRSDAWLAATPEAALIAKTNAQRLAVAIGAIPTPFREALILRELRGLDYREIARITAVPIGTVMSRLARARRRLAAEINAGER
jgi:RNA polymerase sigma-70 factor (ECF subfamily)